MNGLELTKSSHTLLETCKKMKDYNINISYITETNTNWNHYNGRRQLGKIVRSHWKRSHISISNIDTKVNIHYQPGVTTTISTNTISPRMVDKGEDKHNTR